MQGAVQKLRNANFGHFSPLPPYVTKRNVTILPPAVLRNESWSYPPLPPIFNFSLTQTIILHMHKNIFAHMQT